MNIASAAGMMTNPLLAQYSAAKAYVEKFSRGLNAELGGRVTVQCQIPFYVATKLAKMRKESIAMYEQGGKADAAEAERVELAILEEYLPQMADEATVREWISEAIAAVCPDGPDKRQMGKVMGALMKAHKGEFEGKVANKRDTEMTTA